MKNKIKFAVDFSIMKAEIHPDNYRLVAFKDMSNEDVFITNYLNAFDVPKVELAKQFAVEWIFFEDPVGLHHVWSIFPFDIVKQWMQYIIE